MLAFLGCEGPLPRRVVPNAERVDMGPVPPYPPEARRQGLHGDVVLDLILDAQGKPLAAKAVWGPGPLLPTAVAHVKTFTFKPLLPRKGPVLLRFVMPFRLTQGGRYLKAPGDLLTPDALQHPSPAE